MVASNHPTRLFCVLRFAAVLDGDGRPCRWIGGCTDITERRQAEQSLMQTSRLIALGEMAAGMAHELNQPLTVISALAEGMLLRLEEGIEVALELDPGLDPVLGDRYRLEQVLINLIHNARDAVETRHEDMPPSERADWHMRVDIRTRQHGDELVVEVEDNGVGMSEASRLQALEPFFTTKGPDRGTGLGLSISHAIVQDHGGEIECESREGEGTIFRVRLPLPRPSP